MSKKKREGDEKEKKKEKEGEGDERTRRVRRTCSSEGINRADMRTSAASGSETPLCFELCCAVHVK
jgi:hypothetical protein